MLIMTYYYLKTGNMFYSTTNGGFTINYQYRDPEVTGLKLFHVSYF